MAQGKVVLVEVVVEATGGRMVLSGPCRSRAERRAEMSPRRLAPLLILGTILAGLTSTAAADRMSGLYVDNGFDQTIVHRVVSQREKREVEHEILNLLGLPDRPKNTAGRPPQVKRSAPKFLLDIYKNALGEDEDEKPIGEQQRRAGEFDLTGQDFRAIDQSDVIMTFAAHSKSLFRLFSSLSLYARSYLCIRYPRSLFGVRARPLIVNSLVSSPSCHRVYAARSSLALVFVVYVSIPACARRKSW